MRRMRKLIASLLVLCMVVTVMPVNVYAQQADEVNDPELLNNVVAASAEEVGELLEERNAPAVTEEAAPEPAVEEADVPEAGEVASSNDAGSEQAEVNIIENDATGIPDEAFYQAVLKTLDKGEDEKFTYDEAKEITSLDLSGSGVKDFTGIGNFENLEYLDASDNELTELTGFVSLWNLETLILNNNKLTGLFDPDYIYASGIRRLEVAGNEIAGQPDWWHFYRLEILDISNNKITNIDDIYSYNLVEIDASYNEIALLEDFYFSDDLVKLNMSHNKLSELPYWRYRENLSPAFEDGKPLIDISYNKLTRVEMILNLPEALYRDEEWMAYNLQGQDAAGQDIIRNDETGIPDPALYAAILEEGDIDKNGVLTEDEAEYITYLYVGWSSTTSEYYTVKDLTGIEYLKNLASFTINDLEATDLTPLLALTNLTRMTIQGKGVKNLDVIKQLEIDGLTLNAYNSPELSLVGLEEMTSLRTLNVTVPGKDLEYIGKVPNLVSLDLSLMLNEGKEELISLDLLTQVDTLMELYIYGDSYYDWGYDRENGYWEMEYKTKLDSLGCLEDFSKLESVYIYDVTIVDDSSLSALNGLKHLEFLTLSYCGIKDISALNILSSLYSINLSGNEIEEVGALSFLKNSRQFSVLNLGYNNIKDISSMAFIGELTRLSTLYLQGNDIEDISVLEELKNCSRLTNLNLNSNSIKDISALEEVFENCRSLTYLYLYNNSISDISALSALAGSENLYYMDLSNNIIRDLRPLAALADCPELYELGLRSNGLTDLTGIEGLVNLTDLDVSYNELETLPDLTALVNLYPSWTYFYGNKLTAAELKAKMPTHLAENQTWINNNRYDEYEWWEEVVDEYDPEVILDLLEDENVSNVKVILDPEDMSEVESDIFKAAATYGKEISFDVVDDSGNTVYQWSFNGEDIENPDMDLDLSINFATEKQEEIEELTGRTDAMYLSFTHHGELPGPALMTVYVGDQYDDGEIIYLYYYNEENGEIELMAGGLYVSDGYVSFTITHCSDYFLLDELLEENNGGEEPVDPEPEEPVDPEPEEPVDPEPEEPVDPEPEEPVDPEPEEPVDPEPEEVAYTTGLSDAINVSEVINALRNDNYNHVNVILTSPDVVPAAIFQVLRETGKTVSFVVVKEQKAAYQWTYEGRSLSHTDMDADLAIMFESAKKTEIDKLIGDQDGVYLSFAHEGDLPGSAEVTVYVGDVFDDGEVLYLYYYNEATGVLELVTASGLLTGGGYVTFTMDHCSEYVLVSEKVSVKTEITDTVDGSENDTKTTTTAATPATGDNSPVWFLLFALMAAAAVMGYSGNRKKKMW